MIVKYVLHKRVGLELNVCALPFFPNDFLQPQDAKLNPTNGTQETGK